MLNESSAASAKTPRASADKWAALVAKGIAKVYDYNDWWVHEAEESEKLTVVFAEQVIDYARLYKSDSLPANLDLHSSLPAYIALPYHVVL